MPFISFYLFIFNFTSSKKKKKKCGIDYFVIEDLQQLVASLLFRSDHDNRVPCVRSDTIRTEMLFKALMKTLSRRCRPAERQLVGRKIKINLKKKKIKPYVAVCSTEHYFYITIKLYTEETFNKIFIKASNLNIYRTITGFTE